MKNVYKQMTKVIALVALFLFAGNAWSSESWVGYVSGYDNTVSITITTSWANKFVSNLQARANSEITYLFEFNDPSLVGVAVESSNKLYLKPTTDGYMNLRIACAEGSPLTVTIHDNTDSKDVASVNVVTPTVNSTYYGETVLFEVEANHEYVLNASNGTYYVTVVTKIESSEMAVVNEEMTPAQMQAAIGSDKPMVKMDRTLKAGVWNTFCSPIQIGTNAMRAELKCNEAYELNTYNATTNIVSFRRVESIVGGKPYLIMPTEAVSVITVSNRTHPATYNPQSVTSNGLAFRAALGATNIYTTGDASSTKFYLNAQGKFVYPTSNTGNNGTIKGLRGYFEWTNGVPAHDVKAMTFIFEDDETGIITVEKDIFNENATIYSIDGRNMGNSKENLTRGMYIQNGRKFIVK